MSSGFENNTGVPARQDEQDWRRALRREMLARREALPATEHAALSARIVGHLLQWGETCGGLRAGQVVGFCWPVRNEPDVRAVFEAWCAQGAIAALPVVVAADAPLQFRAWTAATRLVEDRYGIPTPATGAFLTPDLLLLPLNAFDAVGYRLGYGGGFFDRTLAQLAPRPVSLGVGFECNRVASIRPQEHDQRLDWVVTEAGVFPAPA